MRIVAPRLCVGLILILALQCLQLPVLGKETLDQWSEPSDLLSSFISKTKNCTINACEALKIVTQLVHLINGQASNSPGASTKTTINALSMDLDLMKRVRQLESRLRSVEQPMWRLVPGTKLEWNHCTSGVCRCNPDTKSFTCWNTNLKSVPVTQVIPMNIVSIDLSRNFLSTLHKDTFRGLTLLQELDLSNNQLNYLPHDLFQDLDSLIQLRIQSNQLEDLDARIFWKLRHLNLLDLSKNTLNEIPSTIFNHVQRLTVINLGDNQIKIFPPGLLRDTLILEEFDLSRNQLNALQSGSVQNLGNLKVLDFSWNAISNIADDFFADLTKLRTLILHNNRITRISRTIFQNLSQLATLDLTMNKISTIHGLAFSELVNLRELLLGQNSLSHIPDRLFVNMASLTRLTLFSNNLTTLEANDFQGLGNLTNLMLNNNYLKFFDAGAFAPLKSLQKLRIDSNKLQYLPHGALHGLDHLMAVKLDKNPWHCDCRALYLARWIREYVTKLWDGLPMCRGPGDLGGHEVGLLRYDDLCDGQWASMLSLSPRLPVRTHRISTPMNYSDYFNLYLRHIYASESGELESNETALPASTSTRMPRVVLTLR